MNNKDVTSKGVGSMWVSMALAAFFASLYFGLFGDIIGTIGWIIFGIMAVFFIMLAFPNTWNYFFWLLVSYLFSWVGQIVAIVISPTTGDMRAIVFVFGIMMVATGYGTIAFLIYHMKKIRDRLCGLFEVEAGTFSKKRQRYVPMGLWAASAIMFFVFVNIGAYGWILWATDKSDIYIYIVGEVLAIITMFYVLWVPQAKLDWQSYYIDFPTTYDARIEKGIMSFISAIAIPRPLRAHGFFVGRERKRRAVAKATTQFTEGDKVSCPRCGGKVKKSTKSCPKCNSNMNFTYCLREEGIIVLCPHCNKHVRYGVDKCEFCHQALSRMIVCRDCGYKGPLSSWR